jgi:hypothetical protein
MGIQISQLVSKFDICTRMRWAEHVTRMGEVTDEYNTVYLKERDDSEDKGIDGRILIRH